MSLTEGSIQQILEGVTGLHPRLQVLDIRLIAAGNRYRLNVSDGVHSVYAMLPSQLNNLVSAGSLDTNTLIQVSDYVVNNAQRRVLVILNMEILGPHPSKIGMPQPAQVTGGAPAPAPEQQQPQQQQLQQQQQPQQYQAAPRAAPSRGAVQRTSFGSSSGDDIIPVSAINMYLPRYTIKVRCTAKTPIRKYTNAKGPGQLCSAEFCDASGEIRATMFNQSVDKFEHLLMVGSIYTISKASVKAANKQYSQVKNDYELFFDDGTMITMVADDHDSGIPTNTFDFRPFDELQSIGKDKSVDVIGIITRFDECGEITTKTKGDQVKRRNMTIVDEAAKALDVTIWGDASERIANEGAGLGQIMAIKGAKISDYRGLSLSVPGSATISINPLLDRAVQLQNYWANGGNEIENTPLTTGAASSGSSGREVRKTLSAIRDEGMGQGERPDYFSVRGFVNPLPQGDKAKLWYYACGTCNKKVTEGAICEKCQAVTTCWYRYMVSLCLVDGTGQQFITVFNDQALSLFGGKSAQELAEMKTSMDPELDHIISAVGGKHVVIKVRVKNETVQDETKLKVGCMDLKPVVASEEIVRMKMTIADQKRRLGL